MKVIYLGKPQLRTDFPADLIAKVKEWSKGYVPPPSPVQTALERDTLVHTYDLDSLPAGNRYTSFPVELGDILMPQTLGQKWGASIGSFGQFYLVKEDALDAILDGMGSRTPARHVTMSGDGQYVGDGWIAPARAMTGLQIGPDYFNSLRGDNDVGAMDLRFRKRGREFAALRFRLDARGIMTYEDFERAQ